MNKNDKKLQSLATMAKRGVGNERENAERLLRTLCEKNNLDYESVLNDLLIEEFSFDFSAEKITKRLAVQTAARYAFLEGSTSYFHNRWKIFVNTTAEKWSDFLVAMSEVKRVYNRERRKMLERQRLERNSFFDGFLRKHELYYPYPTEGGKRKKLSEKDLEKLRTSMRLAEEMTDELKIHRQLGEGSKTEKRELVV
jgi:hypothetical protein